ncbi:MAG TPA: hypothetical protein VGO91_13390 [Pyrinomonadaceae bacterium]|jgi:Tol biopolymer transport system component|nr:hypothetical protein [Pyrinomonadaceae bacterium]
MKSSQRVALCIAVLVLLALVLFNSYARGQKKHQAHHPYDAAEAVNEPKLFAEGVINTGEDVYGPAFAPDGETLYFARRVNERKLEKIFVSRFEKGKWTTPQVTQFSGTYFDKEPFVSPDGKRIFFASRRPVEGNPDKKDFDIWMVEKTKEGWGEPRNAGPTVNSKGYDNYPSVAANGNLYFGSVREGGRGEGDLYVSRFVKGKYEAATNLGEIINTSENEADPYIAPDESYIIFSSERSTGMGEGDLYISFKRNGAWTAPQSLGPKVNSADYEYTPLVSPNGKYLFFSRGWGKIYQIEMSALNLKP